MMGRRNSLYRQCRWLAGLLLVAGSGLMGCATSDCVNPEFERPFGRRFVHFFQMIGSVPSAISEDFALRRKNLARSFSDIGRQVDREVSLTAAQPFPDVVGDARDHWPMLTANFRDLGADVGEDLRCAVPRLWYNLKLLE